MTISDLKKHAAPFVREQLERIENEGKGKKKNKFNATKIEHEGMIFDSKHELKQWMILVVRQKAGEISDLRRQVEYELTPKQQGERRTIYIADFVYIENGELVVCDAKSEATRKLSTYILKRKLMLEKHGIIIQEL